VGNTRAFGYPEIERYFWKPRCREQIFAKMILAQKVDTCSGNSPLNRRSRQLCNYVYESNCDDFLYSSQLRLLILH